MAGLERLLRAAWTVGDPNKKVKSPLCSRTQCHVAGVGLVWEEVQKQCAPMSQSKRDIPWSAKHAASSQSLELCHWILTVCNRLSLPSTKGFGAAWLVTSLLGASQLQDWRACSFSLAPQRCLPHTVCHQDPAVISQTLLIKSSEAVMYFHVFPLFFLLAWAFQIIDDTLVNNFSLPLFSRYLSLEGILFI